MAKYQVISGDTHLEVPCERWTHRIPKQHRDRAPRRVRLSNGGDAWLVENRPLRVSGLELCGGRSYEEFAITGVTYEGTAGTGSPEQRLEEEEIDGIDAEVIFTGIGGAPFWRGISDDAAYLAVIRAYNDYLAEEYCSVAPDRLIGMGVIPETGIDDAIAELEHCKQQGLRGVVMNAFPSGSTYPSDVDDQFWARSLELDMPLTVHVSFNFSGVKSTGPKFVYPKKSQIPEADLVARCAQFAERGGLEAVQLVFARVFDRFPTLKFYFGETFTGWIPNWLEQTDDRYVRNIHWVERELGLEPLPEGILPSDYVREHFLWGFLKHRVGVELRHYVGVDRMLWGSDFTHSQCDWPRSRDVIAEIFDGVPEDEKYRMLAGNAIDFFHLDQS
jgi:predicted TIM-barrel fold metal-dependent hydrolase